MIAGLVILSSVLIIVIVIVIVSASSGHLRVPSRQGTAASVVLTTLAAVGVGLVVLP